MNEEMGQLTMKEGSLEAEGGWFQLEKMSGDGGRAIQVILQETTLPQLKTRGGEGKQGRSKSKMGELRVQNLNKGPNKERWRNGREDGMRG